MSLRQAIPQRERLHPAGQHRWSILAPLAAAALVLLQAGCGTPASQVSAKTAAEFSITPGISRIDTNCTGCNATGPRGAAVEQFSAVLANGAPATVRWSVTGGDAAAGPGRIDSAGRYTPPTYLSSDQVVVVVTARLAANPGISATAPVTISPGFLQPLSPENVALGPGGTTVVSGKLAETGGSGGIRFTLEGSESGAGQGTLDTAVCRHARNEFTTCTATYTAPAVVTGTGVVQIVAEAAGARTRAMVLLNPAGVNSSPLQHQGSLAALAPLGSSGGNNSDYDARGNTIADCCSGTLGALLQDNSGRQYVLSNNHVLARSDHAAVGDAIVQPGLIDNNCTPNGEGPGTVPVATLSDWLPLSSPETNADVAIAEAGSRSVDGAGAILELGGQRRGGTLAPAPPGVSSSGGRGIDATLGMTVAKSGRTTGLTCAGVSAIDMDVSVDYFRDCAETRPYLTKVFRHQIAISGDRFTDAGDSGSLVVDASNAEPVGLFFAGGTDSAGVVHALANPATDVLDELDAQAGGGRRFTFAGGPDHPVSCLNYGNNSLAAAQSASLPDAEIHHAQQALGSARALVNARSGILGVAMGKSSDNVGKAAVLVYVAAGQHASVPATIDGVRTIVIASTAQAVSMGTAPLANATVDAASLPASALAHALRVKNEIAPKLMRQNAAFFAVGVGASLDAPDQPALVIYVDRNRMPQSLPAVIQGVRTRYVIMDRLHVTKAYLPRAANRSCGEASPRMKRDEPLLNLHRPLF